ncbi:MAG: hypothetical protein OXD31_16465 [Chloroflexi bacterium]|nr:hypothetical protein [Chloroflexota bacterium]
MTARGPGAFAGTGRDEPAHMARVITGVDSRRSKATDTAKRRQ